MGPTTCGFTLLSIFLASLLSPFRCSKYGEYFCQQGANRPASLGDIETRKVTIFTYLFRRMMLSGTLPNPKLSPELKKKWLKWTISRLHLTIPRYTKLESKKPLRLSKQQRLETNKRCPVTQAFLSCLSRNPFVKYLFATAWLYHHPYPGPCSVSLSSPRQLHGVLLKVIWAQPANSNMSLRCGHSEVVAFMQRFPWYSRRK